MAAGKSAFTPLQRDRLEKAIATAEDETALSFSVAIGNIPTDEATDERATDTLGLEARSFVAGYPAPAGGVVILIDPTGRTLEVATIGAAHRRIPDRQCGLAVLSMTSRIGVGDVIGAVVDGIRMLAETAGRGEGSAPAVEVGHSAVPAHVAVALPQGKPAH